MFVGTSRSISAIPRDGSRRPSIWFPVVVIERSQWRSLKSVEGVGGGERPLEVVAFFSPLGRGMISGRSSGLPDGVYRGDFERNVGRGGGR